MAAKSKAVKAQAKGTAKAVGTQRVAVKPAKPKAVAKTTAAKPKAAVKAVVSKGPARATKAKPAVAKPATKAVAKTKPALKAKPAAKAKPVAKASPGKAKPSVKTAAPAKSAKPAASAGTAKPAATKVKATKVVATKAASAVRKIAQAVVDMVKRSEPKAAPSSKEKPVKKKAGSTVKVAPAPAPALVASAPPSAGSTRTDAATATGNTMKSGASKDKKPVATAVEGGSRARAVKPNRPTVAEPVQQAAQAVRVELPAGYKPKAGEEYMSAEHLEYFRQKLINWRTELVEESKQTIDNLREEVRDVGDEAERATRETENSLELRTSDRYRKLINKIEKALKRIDDGSYGYCEETGEEIGIDRLEARPIATLCLDAQERWEHRQKLMGD